MDPGTKVPTLALSGDTLTRKLELGGVSRERDAARLPIDRGAERGDHTKGAGSEDEDAKGKQMPTSIGDADMRAVFEGARAPKSKQVTVGSNPVDIETPFPSPADWRDQWIDFLLVDRFIIPRRNLNARRWNAWHLTGWNVRWRNWNFRVRAKAVDAVSGFAVFARQKSRDG
jgi:hypothetical protein